MVEGGWLPGRGGVADRAVRSHLALVCIVLLMAGDALGGRALEERIFVAAGTGGIQVLSHQLKCRLGMVEAGRFPCLRVMACCAVRAEPALMGIVFAVAAGTIFWRVF